MLDTKNLLTKLSFNSFVSILEKCFDQKNKNIESVKVTRQIEIFLFFSNTDCVFPLTGTQLVEGSEGEEDHDDDDRGDQQNESISGDSHSG